MGRPIVRRSWRAAVVVVGATIGIGAVLAWSLSVFGASSVAFAVAVVWLPMTWLGSVSHVVRLRLPDAYHALRGFERDGRIYERFGIRLIKRALRRGPFAVFNPGLHLPATPTPEALAALERRMCTAEASHAIAFGLTLTVAIHAAVRGWWLAAGVTLLGDLLVNGYPILLQRYNRALLNIRFVSAPQ